MSSSSPLRLDADLVRAASAAARLHKRTLPRQIEYWAEIGRAVEKRIAMEDLLAVREGLARLIVQKGSMDVPESGDVFNELETARKTGALAEPVANSPVRYQVSQARPGLLERVERDGRRTLGRFQNGEFVAIQ
jgi:hypothetical protein